MHHIYRDLFWKTIRHSMMTPSLTPGLFWGQNWLAIFNLQISASTGHMESKFLLVLDHDKRWTFASFQVGHLSALYFTRCFVNYKKMSISWDLQLVLISNLHERYIVRKVIDSTILIWLITSMCSTNQNVCILQTRKVTNLKFSESWSFVDLHLC